MNWKSLLILVGCIVALCGCSNAGSPPSGKDSMDEYMKEGPKPADAKDAGGDEKSAGRSVRGRM